MSRFSIEKKKLYIFFIVQSMITETVQAALSSSAVGRNKRRPKGSCSLERQLTFLAYNRGGDPNSRIRRRPKVLKAKRITASTSHTAPPPLQTSIFFFNYIYFVNEKQFMFLNIIRFYQENCTSQ